MEVKKYILAVQGEGRGHMTQAISMYDMLVEQGHDVCAVIVGTSGRREIPKFFFDKIKTKIVQLPSPNFITDSKNKSINITKTVLQNFKELRIYKVSLKRIDALMKEHQPDVVINFFDLLIGLYYRYYKPKAKLICIAHQYIYLHSDFEFPTGRMLDRWAIKFFTRITASRATKKLALSFYNIHTVNEEVIIVPPLLRKEIFELTSKQSDYFLVYLVNNGYFEDIIEWHKANPHIEVHCFTDQPELLRSKNNYSSEKLFLHALNDTLFLEMMSNAKGLASTAGFESVCEAMYLGIPVLMVPVKGHYEQFCNSRDGYRAGAGIFADSFDLSKLMNFCTTFNSENKFYRDWVSNAKNKIYREISNA
ncbi:MAG: glycosyltransferase family protein [Bacteroidota bacterium]|nr:glycosyltransferase family protein [Bacteroidota bacterium]